MINTKLLRILPLIFVFSIFYSCKNTTPPENNSDTSINEENSRTEEAPSPDLPIISDVGIPEKYITLAKDFCECNGKWMDLQMKGEIAKQHQDLTRIIELGDELKKLPNRTACNEALDKKMEAYEKEDGVEFMNENFFAASTFHCPVFDKFMNLAESLQQE